MTSKIFRILARSFEVCLASSYVLRTFFGDNRLSSLQNLSPYDELHADKKSFQNASFISCLPCLSIVFDLFIYTDTSQKVDTEVLTVSNYFFFCLQFPNSSRKSIKKIKVLTI